MSLVRTEGNRVKGEAHAIDVQRQAYGQQADKLLVYATRAICVKARWFFHPLNLVI